MKKQATDLYRLIRVFPVRFPVIAAARLLGLHWIVRKRPGNTPQRLYLRTYASDPFAFYQVFVKGDYAVEYPVEPTVIVDAGANVGFASVYFANRFPNAFIVALEPDAESFALLQKNVSELPNVHCVNAALWSRTTDLALVDHGTGPWGYTAVPKGNEGGARVVAEVPAVDIPTLMERFGLSHIDLLKLDIEGGEKFLFSEHNEWLSRVHGISAELHDRKVQGCSRAFYNATNDFPIEFHRGENVYVFRRPETA